MNKDVLNAKTALALMSAMNTSFDHENLTQTGMANYRKNQVTRMIANWIMETKGEGMSSSFSMAQSFLGERFLGLENNDFGCSDSWSIKEFERRLPSPDVLCELAREGWYLVRSPTDANLRRICDRLERYNFFVERLPEYFTDSTDSIQPGWLAFKLFKKGSKDSCFDECSPPNIAELVWGFGITAVYNQCILFEATNIIPVTLELYLDVPTVTYTLLSKKLSFTDEGMEEIPYFCRIRRFT